MKNSDVGLVAISNYEKTVLKGLKKGRADNFVEQKMVRETLNKILSQTSNFELEDGTTVVATPLELIIASAINDAIENGSFSKVKDIANILGEFNEQEQKDVNVSLSLVDKELMAKACR